MTRKQLAAQLRNKMLEEWLSMFPNLSKEQREEHIEHLDNLSDSEAIDEFMTCPHCLIPAMEGKTLTNAVARSQTVEDFVSCIDTMRNVEA